MNMECMNTTLYFWRREKNQETLMYFCVFWREIWWEKREKNAQNNSQKPLFSIHVQSWMLGAIYSPWHASWGLVAFQGLSGRVGGHTRAFRLGLADVNNFVLMHFLGSNFIWAFGGLPGLRLRRSWCLWKDLDV